jgi:hypothetical protein
MSIIMATESTSLAGSAAPSCGAEFAPEFRELLDHIAAELAEEYVRLMEAAAEAEPEDRSKGEARS